MIIDFHTHKSETAEGIFAIRSFCISEIEKNTDLTLPHSIGLHPWNEPPIDWFERLKQLTNKANCLFVGECGLDKIHSYTTLSSQSDNFKQQITLSESVNKPLVIHCVKAYNEIIEIHKQLQPSQAWIIHGFHGSSQLAQQLRAQNIYVSFGTSLVNTKQEKIKNTIKQLGIGNFFLETDNTDISIIELYKSVAEILDTTISELTSKIDNLFVSLQKI